MSFTKRGLDDQEALRNIAEGLLLETKAISKCEIHEYLLSNLDDEATGNAYKLANARITAGEIRLPGAYTRKDLTDVIKAIADETGEECYGCAKVRDS